MNGTTSASSIGAGNTTNTAPGSPANKRKPVPTPRSTLRKPSAEEQLRKKQIIINNGIDSQGQTSGESGSPEDSHAQNGTRKTGGEDAEDILTALEKIPGVGSLRSLNSVGSSSLTLDPRAIVRRDTSSHSISSGLSLALTSERKKSLGERSRTSPRILLLNGRTNKEDRNVSREDKNYSLDGSEAGTDATSLSSPSTSPSSGKVTRGTEKRRSLKSVKIQESDTTDEDVLDKTIQDRPLPELPPSSLKLRSTTKDDIVEELSLQKQDSDEIYTALLTPEDHYQELNVPTITPQISAGTTSTSTTAASSASTSLPISKTLKDNNSFISKTEHNITTASMPSLNSSKVANGNGNYLTLTGTIKRGKYPEKSLDIQLSVTPDHLSKLEKRVHDKYHDRCFCGLRRGPHVFILSVLSIPFMLIYSAWQAFFLGSMTWYNIFIYYNEERSCCHKLLSPLVLLFYPLWILPVTLGLGFFGAFRVISWYWDSWVAELGNPDSGFMAWACSKMNLPDCAPYAVVLLSADEDAYSADVTSLHRKCHPQNV